MRAIINGKRYDTDKAELLGWESSAENPGDFLFWKAFLYRTPRSRVYFLAGAGGPMTRFAEPVGQNGWQGGEKIIPLTEAQALEWAQRFMSAEAINIAFGDVIQDA